MVLFRGGNRKRGIVSEYLPWLIIAVILLVIILLSIFLLKGKGFQFIDQIKNIFKGG
jgi:sensor domain CHASE-containing protein